MSNGELGKSANSFGKLEFDGPSLTAKVSEQIVAVENADGDVKGATEHMVDEIQAAQRAVKLKKQALATRQQALLEGLKELGLIGRPIDFTWGTALGAADFSDPESPYLEPKSAGENLAGSGGTITDVEVGAFFGNPIEATEAIVFSVEMDEAKGNLAYAGIASYRYVVVASQANYAIGEIPQPEEQ